MSFENFITTSSKNTFTKNDKIEVSFALKNTGPVAGSEVAQVYVRDIKSSHPRPVKELKGFTKVILQPEEQKYVTVTLDKSAFSYWNPDTKAWYAEPGEFKILVGAASDDVRLEESVVLSE